MIAIGIDIGKGRHAAAVLDDAGRPLCRPAFYDNNREGEEHFEDVLQSYIGEGFVSVHPFTGSQKQAYEQCYNDFNSAYDWIGFFDFDEFVEIQDGRKAARRPAPMPASKRTGTASAPSRWPTSPAAAVSASRSPAASIRSVSANWLRDASR